jgi:hypothetical protein
VARTSEEQWELADHLDWVLPYYDPETTEEAYMDEEIKRLKVVKSYLLLDAKREHAFDRITALAARIFDAPISVISQLDLGRQWHVSLFGMDTQVRIVSRTATGKAYRSVH